jgi:chemotaxis receptor (MCP) glutamine deamidase CheD
MVAREILQNHGIQVAAANVGGAVGLRLLFNTRTGAVRAERLNSGDRAAGALPDGRPEPTKSRV